MAKSKSKKSQPKRYPTPTDRYLIVTDPWGGVPISEPNFFNNVTAWFEIMFKPRYPSTRPTAIFYQWTNKNIIIEIPDHIDVAPYLGAHYWSAFLVPPHCFNVGTRVSYVYEFEHRFFPIPASQGGWTAGYAGYTKIRPNFDVKEPYPEPLPAPISSLPYARKLPPNKVLNLGEVRLPPPPSLTQEGSDNEGRISTRGEPSRQPTSLPQGAAEARGKNSPKVPQVRAYTHEPSQSPTRESSRNLTRTPDPEHQDPQQDISHNTPQFDPYQRPPQLVQAQSSSRTPAPATPRVSESPIPSNYSTPPSIGLQPKLTKKLDPYEEEEAAVTFLRAASHTLQPESMSRSVSVKSEVEVKQELTFDDNADGEDEEYEPSSELLEAFHALGYQQNLPGPFSPKLAIKPEHELDDDLPDFDGSDDEGYRPSAALLEAFSTFEQPGKVGTNSDDQGVLGGREYMPSADLLAAMTSLPDGMVDLSSPKPPSEGFHKQTQIKVKSEPQDDNIIIPPYTNVTQLDRERSMTLGRGMPGEGRRLEPRVKREAPEPELYPARPRSGSRDLDSTKRVKLERQQ